MQKSIFLGQLAGVISVILYAIVILQLFMLFYFPVGPTSDPVEVFLRNISSNVVMIIMAIFFTDYRIIHIDFNNAIIVKTTKQLTTVAIILFVACIAKVAISIVYMFKCLLNGNLVGFYYTGEAIVFAAIGLFALTYFKRLKEE